MSDIDSQNSAEVESICVKIEKGDCSQKEFHFHKPFRIGRDEECEIQLNDGIVSRSHVEVFWLNDQWWVSDLDSANGTYVNGEKIDRVSLKDKLTIQIGEKGPILKLNISKKSGAQNSNDYKSPSVTRYIKHYFDDADGKREVGEHTKMIRRAFEVVKKKHSSKYKIAIIGITLIAISVGVYAVYQHINTKKQKALAENIFYNMKSMELEISKLTEALLNSGDEHLIASINQLKDRQVKMERQYDDYMGALGVYDMDEEERLIFNMARIFGECELSMPDEFVDEVRNYIDKWRSSERLKNAILRAEQNGFDKIIVKKMLNKNLAPQFFYLALQESDFKETIVGPTTRYGFAKGVWQFIPKTAIKYGLKLGPLTKMSRYDPRDERFNFDKATTAAANYISDIYNTEAQASGLLVIASYNWGEHNIRDLILKLPGNPKERNFWNILKKYKSKVPKETYNYVFYIFSAAVIGENPKLFGFDFENPLKKFVQNIN